VSNNGSTPYGVLGSLFATEEQLRKISGVSAIEETARAFNATPESLGALVQSNIAQQWAAMNASQPNLSTDWNKAQALAGLCQPVIAQYSGIEGLPAQHAASELPGLRTLDPLGSSVEPAQMTDVEVDNTYVVDLECQLTALESENGVLRRDIHNLKLEKQFRALGDTTEYDPELPGGDSLN